MGFAEQLAKKAAEAKSHREVGASPYRHIGVVSGRSVGSANSNRSISSEGGGTSSFADQLRQKASLKPSPSSTSTVLPTPKKVPSGALDADLPRTPAPPSLGVKQYGTTPQKQRHGVMENKDVQLQQRCEEVRTMTSSSSGSFADQLRLKASATASTSNVSTSSNGTKQQKQQKHGGELLLESDSIETTKQSTNETTTHPMQIQRANDDDDDDDPRTQLKPTVVVSSPIPMQMQRSDMPQCQQQSKPTSLNLHRPQHFATGDDQQQSQSQPVHDTQQPDIHSPTSAIFGAWSQIESLQNRLREAELRAKKESQRAELASYELKMARQLSPLATDVVAANGMSNGMESGESLDSVSLNEEVTTVAPVKSEEDHEETVGTTYSHNPHSNDDLLLWKKRALEAEELFKEMERARVVVSTTQPLPTTPQHTTSAAESDLIRLKNAEIHVLRSQIHRLERRIQEECERNEDIMRSYHHHHASGGPPLVVAEYTTTGSTEMEEFRLLRNEIRHLQYQLSQKSNTGMNGASTTGSTLSSIDVNEDHANYDDEEEVEEEGAGSSWGLCCIRKSRRGYGRVTR
mmetsp:Transcript_5878/g.13055  ORF Transcript_5878/g.13055 Transcript_5878/m.13055 type:complete len:574 (-) Transcript_5878:2098-3819(-)